MIPFSYKSKTGYDNNTTEGEFTLKIKFTRVSFAKKQVLKVTNACLMQEGSRRSDQASQFMSKNIR